MFKNKEINLNQVDLLFQSWKQRQSDNVAASVPEKQVVLYTAGCHALTALLSMYTLSAIGNVLCFLTLYVRREP